MPESVIVQRKGSSSGILFSLCNCIIAQRRDFLLMAYCRYVFFWRPKGNRKGLWLLPIVRAWRRTTSAAVPQRSPLPRNSGTFFASFLVTKKEALPGPPVIKGPAAGQAGPGDHQSKRSFKTFSQKFSQFFHHHIVLCYYYK